MKTLMVLASMGLAWLPSAANAATVFWNVTGTVSSVSSAQSRVAVGDAMSLSVKFDTTFDLTEESTLGWYAVKTAVGGIQVGATYSTIDVGVSPWPSIPGNIDVFNYTTQDSVRSVISYVRTGGSLIDGSPDGGYDFFDLRAFGAGSALTSDRLIGETIGDAQLPTSEIYHSTFSNGQRSDIGYSNIRWSLSPTAAAVPEPSTWAMMILGVGFIGSALRRRAKVGVARAI